MRLSAVALLLLACRPEAPGPDLTERLGPDEARAGVLVDDDALFGGISAEGRVGDVLLYNDRVKFVVQGVRDGAYFVPQGGSVIDADIVRPAGEPGRDAIDECSTMFGLGRLLAPHTVEVVDDGSESGVARVVAEGGEAPLGILVGTLEAPGFIPDLGLTLRTEFVLPAGSWLLEVRSTVTTPADADVTLGVGDALFGSGENLDPWGPGGGLTGAFRDSEWTGYQSRDNQVAYAIMAAPGEVFSGSALGVITQLAPEISGAMSEDVEIPAGTSHTFVRYYGVAPDLATLTDAHLAQAGTAVDTVDGQVTAPDGPVASARVNVLVDGAPYTLAVSDGEGRFSASVPAGAEASVLAVGTATRRFLDLPDGASHFSPYEASHPRDEVLAALVDGSTARPAAEGRDWASSSDPLVLAEAGRLVVAVDDGLPFEVRVYRADAPVGDPRLVPDDPGAGAWALGWARDGDVALDLPPGEYTVRAHRGIRFERDQATVTITSGAEQRLDLALPQAYTHPGWLLGDAHTHASPSADAAIPMEDRLIVAAGVGLQVHFGTDHDHVADYRPLLAPLGLAEVLASVVADEVSPQRRGHHNVYPLEEVPEKPNNGAYAWWDGGYADTAGFHAALRQQHGEDVIIQANHPLEDSGIAGNARWSPGRIREGDRWSEDFDAIEVVNAGNTESFPLYLDLVARGLDVTPMGVSDSHSHTGGSFGASATFLHVGIDAPSELTPSEVRDAVRGGHTIVTRGPFLDLSIEPGTVVTGSATLEVTAYGPSWMALDRLRLYRDGEEVEVVEGKTANFTLDPDDDAVYVVVAEGDAPMVPFYGSTPWAMSGAIRVDVDGDGWTAPKSALTVE